METKKEGQPTEEFLNYIRLWSPLIDSDIMSLIRLICDNWDHGSLGYKIGRKYKNKIKVEFHTLGWSGNERIIDALMENTYIEIAYWYKSIRGGHHYFEIKFDI